MEQQVWTTRKARKVKASWEQVKLAVVMVSSFCSQAKLWENDYKYCKFRVNLNYFKIKLVSPVCTRTKKCGFGFKFKASWQRKG